MENNNPYQNIDTPINNPLEIPKEPVKFKLNIKDPKIKLLLILGIILIILGILSIIVTITRKKPISTINVPTPTPAITVIPTIKESNIPTQFIDKFDQIEKKLQIDEDFSPPQVDTTIGQ
jgi:hypothetical protein